MQDGRLWSGRRDLQAGGWTAGDGRGRPWDGPGTARVMSHDVKRIRLEVYDFSLASTGGLSAGTIAPIVRLVLTFSGVVRPSAPAKTDYEP